MAEEVLLNGVNSSYEKLYRALSQLGIQTVSHSTVRYIETPKTDDESEEQICWGREFEMVGAAKENDLRSISDRISGTMRRFLLEDLRDLGGI